MFLRLGDSKYYIQDHLVSIFTYSVFGTEDMFCYGLGAEHILPSGIEKFNREMLERNRIKTLTLVVSKKQFQTIRL